MPTGIVDGLARFAALIHLRELGVSSAVAVATLAPFYAVVAWFEHRAGADQGRYRTRNFVNDVAYTLFYRGGFYTVLVYAAIANALEPHVGALRLGLLAGLPTPLALLAFWVVGDFLLYWMHRLQHRWPVFWAFHSVHHTQERLNLFTAYRRHPVEKLITDLTVFFGIMFMLLGIPTTQWLPLSVVVTALLALQHAELDWRFGPLYRVLVSPAFHAVHHSTDPRHLNTNFGQLFSAWDFMFGTAADAARPARFGVDGLDMPETLAGQLASPFRQLANRAWRGPPGPPQSTAT